MTIHTPVKPEAIPGLKEIVTKDAAGRPITTFEGNHPSAWMRQFAVNPKRVVTIKTRS